MSYRESNTCGTRTHVGFPVKCDRRKLHPGRCYDSYRNVHWDNREHRKPERLTVWEVDVDVAQ